ncbi:beta-galactosidase [Krasilnikovia cinnamomea]|uniref:Beta-galactosidase n=1 Tax=Krasilnikovia cinnamomea TaxID=349313 RepID=A0A4Q7ZSG8_9ACTN|nr:glycoside hydrolase family 2 TIM barrel-domain containing protein [Krasilnikovia cinnamomea]RZU53419.1 beta-galactosidase [Krasilnikovia cinnamomea]
MSSQTSGAMSPRRRSVRLGASTAAVLAVVSSAIVVAVPAVAAPVPAEVRQRLDLSQGWRFTGPDTGGQGPAGAAAVDFDDSSWRTVDVPHTYNAVDGADGCPGRNARTETRTGLTAIQKIFEQDTTEPCYDGVARGVAWYRKHVTVPASYRGKMLYLQFDAVSRIADVYVNGVAAGHHEGGYSRFRIQANGLRPGQDNVIAVKVSNAWGQDLAPLDADFTFFGGVTRPVSLIATDPLQIRMLDHGGPGVYLNQRDLTDAAATVDVTTRLWNNHAGARAVEVRTVVTDKRGMTVAERTDSAGDLAAGSAGNLVQRVTIANPHRWNGRRDPYLYRVHVQVRDKAAGKVTDLVSQPLGLRTIAVDAQTGFRLNGQPYRLYGVNLHTDVKRRGSAVTDGDSRRDFDNLDEMGATAVRMSHYQHPELNYTLADERGIVLWTEIPLVNSVKDTDQFRASTRAQLTELIRQNYNHPSIAFWGIGNEQRYADDAKPVNDLLSDLQTLAKRESPEQRLTTYATCCVPDTGRIANHADTTGHNIYSGWYTNSEDPATRDGKADAGINGLGRQLDAIHAALPNQPVAVSEYGAGIDVDDHTGHLTYIPKNDGDFHPVEYGNHFHERYWAQLSARPFVWGSFIWNLNEFASDWRAEGAVPGINDKGLISYDRGVKKDPFYFYKATWSSHPTLHLTSKGWTDRRRDNAAHNGPLIDDLRVYSNAERVTLKINGREIGTQQRSSPTDRIFEWADVLRPGDNAVEVTATVAGQTVTDTAAVTLS